MKPKTYKEKYEEFHRDDMWGRFLLWLEKKKLKGGKKKYGNQTRR